MTVPGSNPEGTILPWAPEDGEGGKLLSWPSNFVIVRVAHKLVK